MRSAFNQQRRKRRRLWRDIGKRRARHLALDRIEPEHRVKTTKWDVRPNKTHGPGKSKERK